MYSKRRNFNNIYIAFGLLFLLMGVAIWAYVYYEDYTITEAFFMTVITMSTVGYEEVKPLSPFGMIFTGFLIIFSLGIFAYVVTTVTSYLIDGEFKLYYKYYKVKKQIEKLSNHVIVCGYGRNGRQAVNQLLEYKEKIIIIEKDEDVIKEIKEDRNIIVVQGDATQEETLEKTQTDKAKALITSMPSDADNLFVVLTAREMNPEMKIISRASDDNSDIKLKRAGATNVIMPDKVGGSHMAQLVAEPDIVEFLESISLRNGIEVNLQEIACKNLKSCFVNKTISELDIRNVSGANLIGLKTEEGSYIFNPSPEIQLMPGDKLFALGTPSQIKKLKSVLEDGEF